MKPLCYDCGVIESVREIEKKGEGSGLGAVAGGVAGGLLGHETGGGRGKDVMTVLGAIGGAVAGHQIEKNVKKVNSYEIAIRFEDGTSRLITQDNPPAWRSGDKVRLVNGVITAAIIIENYTTSYDFFTLPPAGRGGERPQACHAIP